MSFRPTLGRARSKRASLRRFARRARALDVEMNESSDVLFPRRNRGGAEIDHALGREPARFDAAREIECGDLADRDARGARRDAMDERAERCPDGASAKGRGGEGGEGERGGGGRGEERGKWGGGRREGGGGGGGRGGGGGGGEGGGEEERRRGAGVCRRFPSDARRAHRRPVR